MDIQSQYDDQFYGQFYKENESDFIRHWILQLISHMELLIDAILHRYSPAKSYVVSCLWEIEPINR